jgi:hypothetical protein
LDDERCLIFVTVTLLKLKVPGSPPVNVVCLYTAGRKALSVIRSIGSEEHMGSSVNCAISAHEDSSKSSFSATSLFRNFNSVWGSRTPSNDAAAASSGGSERTGRSTSTCSSKDDREPAEGSSRGRKSGKNTGSGNNVLLYEDEGWATCLRRFWGEEGSSSSSSKNEGNAAPAQDQDQDRHQQQQLLRDSYRNERLKIFPRVVSSNWAVQAAVGDKPALIGAKDRVNLSYFRGPNYLEIDIDIGSNSVARHTIGLVSQVVYKVLC